MAGARATEVLAQLIDNYLAEAQLLQAMRAAVATKMQQRYTQAAHTLRSASANVGATSVCHCKAVEAMGGAGTTSGALASVLQLRRHTQQLEQPANGTPAV